MNQAVYSLSSLEPLVFGDARPFAASAGARSRSTLEMPNPSTLYGALVRALFHDRLQAAPQETRRKLCDFLLQGPFLAVDGHAAFPTPSCWIRVNGAGRNVLARPILPGPAEGADWPEGSVGLVGPTLADGEICKDPMPQRVPPGVLPEFLRPAPGRQVDGGEPLPNPPRERSAHVAIHPETGKARRGQLYSAEGVRFQTVLDSRSLDEPVRHHQFEVLFSVESPFDDRLPDRIELTLGGERRNAVARKLGEKEERLAPMPNALPDTHRVLLVLATPAAFEGGWIPGWIQNDLPCPNVGVRFRLVSATVPGFDAVSGWGQTERNFGPKPAVWLAPAGSAYFLEAIGPSGPLSGAELEDLRRRLAEAWLKPVSDQSKFRRKGFGATLWGSWTPAE